MGHLQAMEMAALADIDVALGWHLSANHYPPVHGDFIPVAKQAIEAGVEAALADEYEGLDELVTLPNDRVVTIGHVIEGLHLDAFIDAEVQRRRLGEDET